MNQPVARAQENPADIAERYVRAQLSPKPGEEHLSPLLKKRKDFLDQLGIDLDKTYYDTPEKRQAKLAAAGKEFDDAIVAKAREGAVAGGDANTYKLMDPAEKRKKETSTGLIRGIINMLTGFFGGLLASLWDLFKHTPAVADKISNISDNRTSEEKAKDSKAAGVADKLSVDFEIQGITVSFTEDERKKIFNGLRNSEARVTSATTSPSSTSMPANVPPLVVLPGTGSEQAGHENKPPPKVPNETAHARARN
jgi:hypothetical protein